MSIRCPNEKKNLGRLSQKMYIDKQTVKKEIRSGNLIILNFANIGNVWASKEAKLTIRIVL